MEVKQVTFTEEVRCGYRISSETKILWNIQLQMLNVLLDVCKRNSLGIWADSGTLLGCVRHGGYIPWDDDIDMIMLREDYDKLIEIAPKEIKKPYYFQSAATEKHPYPIGHAQMRIDGTAAILPEAKRHKYHQGIFIDIFVLDRVPTAIEEIEAYSESIHHKKDEFHNACVPLNFTTSIRSYIAQLFKRLNWRKYFYSFEKEITQYKDSSSNRIANISLTHDVKRMTVKSFPIEWYSDTIMLPFEDHMMPCPSHYDDILTTFYGDYMTPVQAPTMHGGYAVIDTGNSYKQYLRKFRWNYRKEALKSLLSN